MKKLHSLAHNVLVALGAEVLIAFKLRQAVMPLRKA